MVVASSCSKADLRPKVFHQYDWRPNHAEIVALNPPVIGARSKLFNGTPRKKTVQSHRTDPGPARQRSTPQVFNASSKNGPMDYPNPVYFSGPGLSSRLACGMRFLKSSLALARRGARLPMSPPFALLKFRHEETVSSRLKYGDDAGWTAFAFATFWKKSTGTFQAKAMNG